jgi:cysteine desulfurase
VATDNHGRVDLAALAEILTPEVTLVSVMLVNNESGVVQSLDPVADLIAEHAPNALLHTDAVQAFPWIDVATAAARADMISISAHKFGGPKGVGALVIREGVDIAPQLIGGGQERDRRSGTQNVPGIVAMAAAAQEMLATRDETVARIAAQRDRLVDGLVGAVDGMIETAVVDGDRSQKVAGSCHVCVQGVESEALLVLLERENIFGSAASSCSSGAQDPSHVLAAMGMERSMAAGSLRLSLGFATTDAEIDHALAVVPGVFDRLKMFG